MLELYLLEGRDRRRLKAGINDLHPHLLRHMCAEIAGDAFWALQAHNDGHGWMPIPADTTDPATAPILESGQWWALYYTGIETLVNTAQDMAARAQVLRRHNYAMRGGCESRRTRFRLRRSSHPPCTAPRVSSAGSARGSTGKALPASGTTPSSAQPARRDHG